MFQQPQLDYLNNNQNTRFGNNISALIDSQDESKKLLQQIVQNTSNLTQTIHSKTNSKSDEEIGSINFDNISNQIEQQQSKIFATFQRLSNKASKGFNLDWIDKFEEKMAEVQNEHLDHFIEKRSEYYGMNYTEINLMTRSANSLISKYESFEAKQLALLSGIYDVQRYALGHLSKLGGSDKTNPIDQIEKDYNVDIVDKLSMIVKTITPKAITKTASFLSPLFRAMLDPISVIDYIKHLPYKITNKLGIGLKDSESSSILKKTGLYETIENKAFGYLSQAFPIIQDEQLRVEYAQLEALENIFDSINDITQSLSGGRREFDKDRRKDDKTAKKYDALTSEYITGAEYKSRMQEREKAIDQEMTRDRGLVKSLSMGVLSKIPGVGKYIPDNKRLVEFGMAGLENQVKQQFKDKQEDIKFRNIERDRKTRSNYRMVGNVANLAALASLGLLTPVSGLVGGVNSVMELPNMIGGKIFGEESGWATGLGLVGGLGLGELVNRKVVKPLVTDKRVNIGSKIYERATANGPNANLSTEIPFEVIMNLLSKRKYDDEVDTGFLGSGRNKSEFLTGLNGDDRLKLEFMQYISQEKSTHGKSSEGRKFSEISEGEQAALKSLLENLKKEQRGQQLKLSGLDMADSLLNGLGSINPLFFTSRVSDQLIRRFIPANTARTDHFIDESAQIGNNVTYAGSAIQTPNIHSRTVLRAQVDFGDINQENSPLNIFNQIKQNTIFGTSNAFPIIASLTSEDRILNKLTEIEKNTSFGTNRKNPIFTLTKEDTTRKPWKMFSGGKIPEQTDVIVGDKPNRITGAEELIRNGHVFPNEHPETQKALSKTHPLKLASGGDLPQSALELNQQQDDQDLQEQTLENQEEQITETRSSNVFLSKITQFLKDFRDSQNNKPEEKKGIFDYIKDALKYVTMALGGALVGKGVGSILDWITQKDGDTTLFDKIVENIKDRFKQGGAVSAGLGVMGGMAAGAALGFATGNIFLGIGASILGGAIGGLIGWLGTDEIQEKLKTAWENFKIKDLWDSLMEGQTIASTLTGAAIGSGVGGLFFGVGGAVLGGALGGLIGWIGAGNIIEDIKKKWQEIDFTKFTETATKATGVAVPLLGAAALLGASPALLIGGLVLGGAVTGLVAWLGTDEIIKKTTEAWEQFDFKANWQKFIKGGTDASVIGGAIGGVVGGTLLAGPLGLIGGLILGGAIGGLIGWLGSDKLNKEFENSQNASAIEPYWDSINTTVRAFIARSLTTNLMQIPKAVIGSIKETWALLKGAGTFKDFFNFKEIFQIIFSAKEIKTAMTTVFAKSNPITTIIFGFTDIVTDFVSELGNGITNVDLVKVLGGSDKGGFMSMLKGMGKWGAIGATAGIVGGPPGMLIGLVIGNIIGAVVGYFGNDKIHEFMKDIGAKLQEGLDIVLEFFGNIPKMIKKLIMGETDDLKTQESKTAKRSEFLKQELERRKVNEQIGQLEDELATPLSDAHKAEKTQQLNKLKEQENKITQTIDASSDLLERNTAKWQSTAGIQRQLDENEAELAKIKTPVNHFNRGSYLPAGVNVIHDIAPQAGGSYDERLQSAASVAKVVRVGTDQRVQSIESAANYPSIMDTIASKKNFANSGTINDYFDKGGESTFTDGDGRLGVISSENSKKMFFADGTSNIPPIDFNTPDASKLSIGTPNNESFFNSNFWESNKPPIKVEVVNDKKEKSVNDESNSDTTKPIPFTSDNAAVDYLYKSRGIKWPIPDKDYDFSEYVKTSGYSTKRGLDNLLPGIKDSFFEMAKEYFNIFKEKLPVASAFRSVEKQSLLGGGAAAPGRSMHNLGAAIDLADESGNLDTAGKTTDKLKEKGLLQKYGFWPRIYDYNSKNSGPEHWHIEDWAQFTPPPFKSWYGVQMNDQDTTEIADIGGSRYMGGLKPEQHPLFTSSLYDPTAPNNLFTSKLLNGKDQEEGYTEKNNGIFDKLLGLFDDGFVNILKMFSEFFGGKNLFDTVNKLNTDEKLGTNTEEINNGFDIAERAYNFILKKTSKEQVGPKDEFIDSFNKSRLLKIKSLGLPDSTITDLDSYYDDHNNIFESRLSKVLGDLGLGPKIPEIQIDYNDKETQENIATLSKKVRDSIETNAKVSLTEDQVKTDLNTQLLDFNKQNLPKGMLPETAPAIINRLVKDEDAFNEKFVNNETVVKPKFFNEGTTNYAKDPEFLQNLTKLESEYKLPKNILYGLMQTESAGDPNATSGKNARGLFQFVPDTAKKFNINPNDPHQSAEAAAKYLTELYKEIHKLAPSLSVDDTWAWALRAYNWGIGNVTEYFHSVKIPNAKDIKIPKETSEFAEKVFKFAGNNKIISSASNAISNAAGKVGQLATDLFNNPMQTLDHTLAETIRMFGGVFGGLMKFADTGDASDILNTFGLGDKKAEEKTQTSVPNSGPPAAEAAKEAEAKSKETVKPTKEGEVKSKETVKPTKEAIPVSGPPTEAVNARPLAFNQEFDPASLTLIPKISKPTILDQALPDTALNGFEITPTALDYALSDTSPNFFNNGSVVFKKESPKEPLEDKSVVFKPKEEPKTPENPIFPLITQEPKTLDEDISDIIKNVNEKSDVKKNSLFGDPSDSAFSDMSNGFYLVPYKSGANDAVMSMIKKEYEARLCDPTFTTTENPLVLSPEQLMKAKWYDKGANVDSEMDKFLKDNPINSEIFGPSEAANEAPQPTKPSNGFKNPLSDLLSFFGHGKSVESEYTPEQVDTRTFTPIPKQESSIPTSTPIIQPKESPISTSTSIANPVQSKVTELPVQDKQQPINDANSNLAAGSHDWMDRNAQHIHKPTEAIASSTQNSKEKDKYQRGYEQISEANNFEGRYSKDGTRDPNTWYIIEMPYKGKKALVNMYEYEYRKRLEDPTFTTKENPYFVPPENLKNNSFAFLDALYKPDASNLNELWNFRIKDLHAEYRHIRTMFTPAPGERGVPTKEEQLKYFNDGSFDPEVSMFNRSPTMKPVADTNYSLRRAMSESDILSIHSASDTSPNSKKSQATTVKHPVSQPIQPQIINNSVVNSAGQPPLVDTAISEYINNLFSLSPMILQKQVETYSIGQQAMLI